MPEISVDDFKKMLEVFLARFKILETELVVHQTVILLLKPQFPRCDDYLKETRENPGVRQVMDNKYDKILESWHSHLDEVKQVSEFFQAWKPQGPIQ
jgi:hypothetical protein